MGEIDWSRPNREGDAWIAENVMGFVPHPVEGHERWDSALWTNPQGEHCLRDDHDGIPFYTRDIAAAWQVVEKLGLALVPQSDGDGFRWLAMDCESVSYGDGITLHDRAGSCVGWTTAPLAICHVASLALEVDRARATPPAPSP
jgi:hypothetical protein